MRRPEEALQRAVADMLNTILPDDVFWCHIPNGGRRSKAEGGILKAMGVKAGVPDLLIIHGGRAVFCELKAGRGRLSPAQKATETALARAGAPVHEARSINAVLAALDREGIPHRGGAA